MKIPPLLPAARTTTLAAALSLLSLPACRKQPPADSSAANAASQPAAPSQPAAAAPNSLAAHADKLGFAAHLPKDTELYFGSVNLKNHLASAEKSVFWKDLSAFIDDKVPAAARKNETAGEPIKDLWGDDFFVALSKGSSPALTGVREFSDLYTEVTYRLMMAGGPLAGNPAESKTAPEKFVKVLLDDPKMLKRVADAVAALRVPSIIAGVKVDKPADLLKKLLPDDKLTEFAKKARVTDVTSTLGGKFKCYEFQMRTQLTDEVKKKLIEGVPQKPGPDDPRAIVAGALDALQAKTCSVAIGTAGGYIIVAAGQDASHLQFTENPSASLLEKPVADRALPFAAKDLLAFYTADASVMRALTSPRPLQPLLRGIVAGLKASPMFRELASGLEPRLIDMGELEERVYKHDFTDAAGIGWWDQGLRLENFGGMDSSMFDLSVPRRFASLLDDPGLIFGINYVTQPDVAAAGRAYGETWVELIHHVAGELLRSGLGGPQSGQMFELAEKAVIPELLNFYHGSKMIDEKALGPEQAFISDLGGKLNGIPGVPPELAEKKMIRFAAVHPVISRPLLASSWASMEGALKRMAAALPSPTPIAIPSPLSSEKGGVTTYFYPIPFATEDLMPCASLNDKLFILGTSKNLNESLASRLASPAAPKTADTSGVQWRLSFGNLRELVRISASASKAPPADEVKSAMRWMAPFEDMRGRSWKEDGRRRDSLTWEIHDVKKFD